MRWKTRLMVAAAIVLMLASWACAATAGDLRLQWTVPCFEPTASAQCESLSEIPETTFASLEVYGVRFRDNDTLYFGSIPELRRECHGDSADFTYQNGTMGEMLFWSKDKASHLSCGPAHYVFAIPADSTWDDVPLRLPGLAAQYWDNPDLTGDTVTATDSLVDFVGGAWPMSLAPIPSGTIGPGYFSARWIGEVALPIAGTWTFCVDSDDGARLWINDQALMDRWSATGRGKACGSTALTAGVYALKLDYRQEGGGSLVRLLWTPPGSGEQTVPAEALSH